MGGGIIKPVTSIVLRRWGGAAFQVGLAEMNGWRPSMEDAHMTVMGQNWGIFGIFDGHGGNECSEFIAKRFAEEVKDGPPEDDAGVTSLALQLDQEFIDTGESSGSTSTFAIVKAPSGEGGKYLLRVGNIGDSRVLLAHQNGSIFEGRGTDFGLTTDHRPDRAIERARIERCGGTVQNSSGIARVNGDLAVARAFGDAAYKTGGPRPEDHPVIAVPELNPQMTCAPSDFLLLVCDGISENGFPNREVVNLAAQELQESLDPALAAAAVCREAFKRGSRDNLSCMLVLLGGKELVGPEKELLPGPFDAPENLQFRRAYAAMAEHAGKTLAQAVEMRYDAAQVELKSCSSEGCDVNEELAAFGEGPPSSLLVGSEERTHWFEQWLEMKSTPHDDDAEGLSPQFLQDFKKNTPRLHEMTIERGVSRVQINKEPSSPQITHVSKSPLSQEPLSPTNHVKRTTEATAEATSAGTARRRRTTIAALAAEAEEATTPAEVTRGSNAAPGPKQSWASLVRGPTGAEEEATMSEEPVTSHTNLFAGTSHDVISTNAMGLIGIFMGNAVLFAGLHFCRSGSTVYVEPLLWL